MVDIHRPDRVALPTPRDRPPKFSCCCAPHHSQEERHHDYRATSALTLTLPLSCFLLIHTHHRQLYSIIEQAVQLQTRSLRTAVIIIVAGERVARIGGNKEKVIISDPLGNETRHQRLVITTSSILQTRLQRHFKALDTGLRVSPLITRHHDYVQARVFDGAISNWRVLRP